MEVLMQRFHIHDGYDEIPQSPLERLQPFRDRKELRRSTFKSWPMQTPSPDVLCNNGFYYMGIDDKVQCAFCGGVLSGWRSDDNIEREHARHFGKCPFVHRTLMQHNDVEADGCENDDGDYDGDIEIDGGQLCHDQGYNFGNTNEKKDKTVKPKNINFYNKDYSLYDKRLDSFKNWPKNHHLKPSDLAAAGLYYKGEGDRCQCYACGGILEEWEEGDIPKEEHKKWFKNRCQLIDSD